MCGFFVRCSVILFVWSLSFQQVLAQTSGVSPNVLVLPSGPGSLTGIGENVQANLNMGLMSYPIRVLLPEGRNKFTPQISIVYSSSAGAGVMGIGWTLQAGGSVERLTVRGLPTYTNADRFYGGTGELVKIPNSPFYRSRYEGAFVRYRWHQTNQQDQQGYWTAQYPDGSTEYYGADQTGKIDAESQVSGIQGTFRWELRAHVDRNGNRIEYHYTRLNGQVYLDRIDWVFDQAGNPLYSVTLKYEQRPDPISDGKPGFDLRTEQRITEMLVTSESQRVRSFQFTYDTASGLSRLVKVTRYGVKPGEAFPIAFSMKYSDAVFSSATSRMVTMPTSVGQNFKAGNSDFIDMNGDGLPDVVNTSGPTHRFHLNTLALDKNGKPAAHDFPTSRIVDNPKPVSAKLSQASVQLLDVNGDGFTDLVDAVTQKIYLNKGNQHWEDQSQALASFPDLGKNPNLRFFDYNGDKAIDLIESTKDNTAYWVNDGKGSWTRVPGSVPIGASFATDKLRLIDINGDGLSDAVQLLEGKLRYRKYFGHGRWSDWIELVVPGLAGRKLGDKPQFADINGDGLADMVAFVGTSVVYFVNKNGVEFAPGQEIQKLQGVDIPDSTQNSIRIADLNGNGSRDIVWITDSGQITYLELFAERPNLLREISNGIGQRINVAYGSSVYAYLRDLRCDPKTDKACAGPWKNKMPMAFTVVKTITTWASHSPQPGQQSTPTTNERPQIQNVYYHDGFYDGKEKTFRGFRHVETVYDGDDSVGTRKDELKFNVGDQDTYFHGKLLARIVSDGATHQYRQVQYRWESCPVALGATDGNTLDPPVRFVCQTAQETTFVEGETDQAKWRITRNELTYDGFGNVVLVAELGEKDQPGDEKYTQKEFITPKDPNATDAKWFLRAAQRIRYCEAKPTANTPCAEIRYYFDGPAFQGLPLGQIEQGNVSRVQVRKELGQDSWVEPIRSAFDHYGNIVAYQGFSGQIRTVEWDKTYQRFPVREAIKLKGYSLAVTSQWDTRYGLVLQSTDYNGHTLSYKYDNFGRILSIRMPDDPADKPFLRYRYDIKAPISRIVTEKRSQATGEYDRKSIQCLDGLGREFAQVQQLTASRFLVFSHTTFNRLNGRHTLWNPYEATQDCTFTPPTNVPSTRYYHDGLARLIRLVLPDGSEQRTVYTPLGQREYDQEDNRKDSPFFDTPKIIRFDGLGRTLKTTVMPAKGETIVTKFQYSTLNYRNTSVIAAVLFPDGSQKKNEYDLLGNVVKIIDPDRGELRFRFDNKNQLVERTDARSKSLVFTYDALGRPATQQEKDRPETKVTYTFDRVQPELPQALNLGGKLARITYPGGSFLFSYSVRGDVVLERHITMGVNFDFAYTYTHDNTVGSQTLPDGQTFTIQRDGAGRILSIPGVIKEIKYSSSGPMQSWLAENGVRTTYTFNKKLWPTRIDVGDGKVFRLDYTLDSHGNVLQLAQQHGADSFTNTYLYDAIYRLRQANVGSQGEVLSYGMNAMHNITSKVSSLGAKSPVNLGKFSFDTQRVHALVDAGQIKFSYDAAGHVTKRGDTTMQWDALGRCVEAQRNNAVVARSWYGTGPFRVIKEEGGLHTFYINDAYEIRDGTAVTYLKMAKNRTVAIFNPAFLSRFYDDVAPATGDTTLTPQPDGQITAGDAWLYHAGRNKLLTVPLKQRPIALDLTRDMLQASVTRLLDGDKAYTHFYHTDHLGSIRAVTDGKGEVISRLHYYPYGQVRKLSGKQPAYGYMGAEFDRATQTVRFPVRSLDPVTGRWLRPDPAFMSIQSTDDEFNSYGMVLNNPIRMRELLGTTSHAGIVDFGLGQTGQEVLNVAVPMAGLALGGMAFYQLETKVFRRFFGPTPQNSGKRGQRIATALYATSVAATGVALGLQQYGAGSQEIVFGLSLSSFAAGALYEAVNVTRAYKKFKQAASGGRSGARAGVATIAASGLAGLGTVGAGVAYGLGAPMYITMGTSALAAAVSFVSTRYFMARLDKAKTNAKVFTVRSEPLGPAGAGRVNAGGTANTGGAAPARPSALQRIRNAFRRRGRGH